MNSMNTKTLKTTKRHVAALPIQTGRSRGWSSDGSGVSLPKCWDQPGSLGGCRRNQVGSSDWDDSVLFSVRINGNMI
jgi:hypothetical protein